MTAHGPVGEAAGTRGKKRVDKTKRSRAIRTHGNSRFSRIFHLVALVNLPPILPSPCEARAASGMHQG
jgi:hypothetical protein